MKNEGKYATYNLTFNNISLAFLQLLIKYARASVTRNKYF